MGVMGVAKGALRPWSPYLIFILCRQPFLQKGPYYSWVNMVTSSSKRKQWVWLLIWLKQSGNPVARFSYMHSFFEQC